MCSARAAIFQSNQLYSSMVREEHCCVRDEQKTDQTVKSLTDFVRDRSSLGQDRERRCAASSGAENRSRAAHFEAGIRGHSSASATPASQMCGEGHGSGGYPLEGSPPLKIQSTAKSRARHRRGALVGPPWGVQLGKPANAT